MSEGELSGTFKIVSQFWLLCADVPEHVGNARPPHVQAAVVLVRCLGALLAPLHRLDQFPDSIENSLLLSIIQNTSASSPKVLASPPILDPHPGQEMDSKVIFESNDI